MRVDCPELQVRCFSAFLKEQAFSPHRHDVYIFGLTTQGVQCFDYRGCTRHALPGDLVVLHPDELHDGRAGTEAGFGYRAIAVPPESIGSLLPGQALPFVRGGISADPQLKQAVSDLLIGGVGPPDSFQLADGVVQIARALANACGSKEQASVVDLLATQRACDYIHAHLDQVVQMADLEHATGQDRWQLSRDFRVLHGTSPYRYLLMRRLDAARERMLRGDSAATAAVACGFSDQSHMQRQFKATHGLTPGRWRQCIGQQGQALSQR
ncbi:MAG TPA: AraC family transcriptional regulator [Arenimonas sp.]|nr:AraC family transcriptional regulator [Arenimonas sp.]